MYGFIYVTENLITGQKYIGQKKYIKGWEHYLGSGIRLKNSITKYGRENFKRTILEECDSKESLDEKEKYYIELYHAVESDEFYNIAKGGDGGNTFLGMTDEEKKDIYDRRNISSRGKNSKLSEEDVLFIKKSYLNNELDQHQLADMFNVSNTTISKILTLANWSWVGEEFNDDLLYKKDHKKKEKPVKEKRNLIGESNPFYGKHHSEETKMKMREAKRRRATPILCVTTNKIFDTISDASEYYNIPSLKKVGYLIKKGDKRYFGTYNGEKLEWKFLLKENTEVSL